MSFAGAYRSAPDSVELMARVHRSGSVVCASAGVLEPDPALATELGVGTGLSPTQIAAAAYKRYGVDTLARLHGSWALVLWDETRREGVIATDPLASRQVLFAPGADGVAFAEDPVDLPGGPRPPDERSLAHWLARRPLPVGATLLEGVSQLAPGHLLRIGRGCSALPVPWWTPSTDVPAPRSRADAVEQLRAGMRAAVARSAERTGEAAVMLSGGFDSLSVLALLAELEPEPRAYSVVFPGLPEVDEGDRIAMAAERHGGAMTAIEHSGGSPLRAAGAFAERWGLPPASPNGFVWAPLFEQAAADGVTTVIDGEGGDELFGCSPQLIADHLRALRVRAAVDTARRLPGYDPSRDRQWVRRALRTYGVRDALPARLHRMIRSVGRAQARPAPAWISDRARALLTPGAGLEWKTEAGPRWRAALLAALVEDPGRRGSTAELRRAAEMAGLHRRHPWRDLRLIELVLELPPELALDPERDRPLARDAMSGILDERLRASSEKPHFNRVLDSALADERRQVRELLHELPSALGALVDPQALQRTVDSLDGHKPGWGARIWPLLSACVWLGRRPGGTGA